MRSQVAETLRETQREEVLRLSPEERMRLSLELGDRCARLFAAARRLSTDEAIDLILARRKHQRARR